VEFEDALQPLLLPGVGRDAAGRCAGSAEPFGTAACGGQGVGRLAQQRVGVVGPAS